MRWDYQWCKVALAFSFGVGCGNTESSGHGTGVGADGSGTTSAEASGGSASSSTGPDSGGGAGLPSGGVQAFSGGAGSIVLVDPIPEHMDLWQRGSVGPAVTIVHVADDGEVVVGESRVRGGPPTVWEPKGPFAGPARRAACHLACPVA
jgi:hypothetical protein